MLVERTLPTWLSQLFVVIFFLALTGFDRARALRIQDVSFPSYAMLGQTVTMSCDYQVNEGEYVDSIKWYKDNQEFYRIRPNVKRERERVVFFPKPGIKLDRQNSGVSRRNKCFSASLVEHFFLFVERKKIGNKKGGQTRRKLFSHGLSLPVLLFLFPFLRTSIPKEP